MFDKVRIKYLVYLFIFFVPMFVPLTIMTKRRKRSTKKYIRWNKNGIFFTADEEQKKKGENSLL